MSKSVEEKSNWLRPFFTAQPPNITPDFRPNFQSRVTARPSVAPSSAVVSVSSAGEGVSTDNTPGPQEPFSGNLHFL
jgi:hypothetical protein